MRTGLDTGRESLKPSPELLLVVRKCWPMLLLERPVLGGSPVIDEGCLTAVSGDSSDKTSRTLSGDWVQSAKWSCFMVTLSRVHSPCLYSTTLQSYFAGCMINNVKVGAGALPECHCDQGSAVLTRFEMSKP